MKLNIVQFLQSGISYVKHTRQKIRKKNPSQCICRFERVLQYCPMCIMLAPDDVTSNPQFPRGQ